MKKMYLILSSFILFLGCIDNGNIEPDQHQQEMKKIQLAHNAYRLALKQIRDYNPTGFLKLYEISKDDITYTIEISEIAHEELIRLLYFETELWVKTFSKIDFDEFKNYLDNSSLIPIELPNGVASEIKYRKSVISKLNKISCNNKERKLVNYIHTRMSQE